MFRIFIKIVAMLSVTFTVGKWGIYMACLERGYEAIGGEYCLILLACWAAGTAADYLFDMLEDFQHEWEYRKEGS